MSMGSAAGDGPSVAPIPPSSDGSVAISDAKTLFLGDYSRQGHDLLIEHGGTTHVVQDYFVGQGANLVGPNGAFLTPAVVQALAGPAAPGQYAQAGAAPAATALVEIGKVVSVEGTATATHSDGVTVNLANGDPVYQGDIVRTEAQSKLGISFLDDSVFSMSADARMVLDELVFDPSKVADSSMVVNLVQGSFVFVTGQIAPTGNMKVETPVATMGIRGTTPKVLINTDLGVTEFTILPDPGSGKIGSYLLIDKTTGEILGTVESVGDKWVITSLSDEAVKVAKSGLDLLEDERALADIRDAVSNALGKRTEYDGSNSFQQVAFDSSASAGDQDGTGGPSDGGAPGGGDGGVVDPTPDKDDPPITGDDAFTTNEDAVLVGGNVINGSGGGADVDPDGFGLTVKQVNGANLTFTGGVASVVLPANASDQTVGALLVIGQNGGITYDPTSAFNYLAVDEYRTESFSYTVTDKFGYTGTATVTIRVDGRNDAPVITEGPVVAEIAESSESGGAGGGFTGDALTGTLAFTDVDITDTGHEYEVISVVEQPAGGALPNPLGTEALLAMLNTLGSSDSGTTGTDGTIVWTFTGTEDEFDYLAAGESVTLVYTVQVTDPHGATDTQTVTIKIVGATDTGGSNDAPVISVEVGDAATAGRDETNAELTASGTLTVTEIDRTDEVDLSVVSVAATGTTTGLGLSNATLKAMLSLSSETILTDTVLTSQKFTWTFDSNGQAFDYLADGETLILTYTVRADDDIDTGDHTVTITITGTNDAPVVTSAAGGADLDEAPGQTGEDAPALEADGTIAFTDVDVSENAHQVSVTVEATGATTELALDNDDLKALFDTTVNQTGATGINGSVDWTFEAADQAFDYLADGDVLTLTYTVTITDAEGATAEQDVTITVTGTNDAPVITSAAGGADLDEAAGQTGEDAPALEANGTIAFTDVDVSENAHEVSVAVEASGVTTGLVLDNNDLKALFGTTVNQTGATGVNGSVAWTFDAADQALDYLADGEVLTLTYTVTITDAEGATAEQDVTITVTGSNDAPEIVVQDTPADVFEDDSVVALRADFEPGENEDPNLNAWDIAGPDDAVALVQGSSGYSVAVDTTEGEASLGRAVQTEEGKIYSLDFRVAGSVDGLTVTWGDQVLDFENAVVVATDGDFTYYRFDGLVGEADETGIEFVFADDTGQFSLDDVGAASMLTASGALSVSDVDATDILTVTATYNEDSLEWGGDPLPAEQIAALTAGFTADADGWDYSVANSLVQFLGEGETITFSYTVTVTDDSGQTANNSDSEVVTITITGTNDAPVAQVVSGSADEDGPSIMVTADFSDADLSDTHSFSVDTTGTLGSVVDDGDGTFSYSANGQFEYLAAGETATDSFSYTVTDDEGASSTEMVTITITGTNDAPEIGAATGEVVDDPVVLSATVSIDFTDADLADSEYTSDVTGVWVDDPAGGLTLTPAQLMALVTPGAVSKAAGSDNGSVTLGFSAASTVFDYLTDGEVTLIYTVEIDDGGGGVAQQSFALTISASDEGPVVAGVTILDDVVSGVFDNVVVGTQLDDNPLEGTADADLILGLSGSDALIGHDGNDTLYGGEGDDWLVGGDGTDTYIGGGTGSDQFDSISFRDEAGGAGVYANLTTGEVTDTYGNTESATGIEEVDGSANEDELIGNEADNYFQGHDGSDSYDGAGGGFDQVSFADEAGTLGAVVNLADGIGTDTWGNAENFTSIEVLRGSQNGDTFTGDANNNTFRGLAGDDEIDGGDGWDTVRYDRDANYPGGGAGVTVSLLAGTATDGFGDTDTLFNIERVIGTDSGDWLIGDNDDNELIGLDGADDLEGFSGNDYLEGGAGDDELVGGLGDDWLVGGEGLDSYDGGDGPDQYDTISFRDETGGGNVFANLATGQVTDTYGNSETAVGIEDVDGSANDDTLIGNADDNFFRGFEGNDSFDGGVSGYDQVSYDDETGGDGAAINLALGTGTDTYGDTDSFTNINVLRGSQWNDGFIGNDAGNVFFGMGGDDTLNGAGGEDMVRYDRDIRKGGTGGVTVDLAGGTATDGFGDEDTLISIEHARGTEFNDTIAGSDVDNQLEGLGGDDTLLGDAGNDRLFGGDGADELTGGEGSDEFIFLVATDGTLEVDTILDFDSGDDVVNLESLLSASFNPATPQDEIRLTETAPGSDDSILQVNNGTGWVDVAVMEGISAGETISIIYDQNHEAISFANASG